MAFATKWALMWFGCFFAIAFSDIAWWWLPLIDNAAVNFGIGAAVALIGFAPMVFAMVAER